MRIGIYLDVRNPPPWRRPWTEVYAATLDLVAEAERRGADSVWLTEHHLFEDGYLPQPLTLAAAIAEEAAVVDLLSAGRLELGLGGGYRAAEFEAYGADVRTRFSVLDRRAEEVRALLGGTEVQPPPAQQPVPMWLGYGGTEGAGRTGKMGFGLLTLNPETLEPYRAGLVEGGHEPSIARMAGLVYVLVADDPDATWDQIGPHVAYQLHSYARYHAEGIGRPVPPVPEPEEIRALAAGSARVGLFPNFAVLTVDETVELLAERARGIPVVEAFFWASIAGMPGEVAARHVELLCDEVRPRVIDL